MRVGLLKRDNPLSGKRLWSNDIDLQTIWELYSNYTFIDYTTIQRMTTTDDSATFLFEKKGQKIFLVGLYTFIPHSSTGNDF